MQITLSFDNFTELPYTSGTIQNISSQATVEICQDDTANTGLILGPGEWFSWSNSTVYARSAWDYEPVARCAVVPFKKGGEGGGSGGENYSTEEKIIGTWIDGKPLYKITVDCGALPSKDNKSVSINTTNIKDIVDIQGVAHTVDGNNSYWRNIPRIQDNSTTANTTVQINYEQNPPRVTILARTANNTNCDKSYITIKYTKTTD